jgi:hypothetical protein
VLSLGTASATDLRGTLFETGDVAMGKERKTEALYHRIDKFLTWIGLSKAVKGIPSLLAAVFVSVVFMECVAVSAPVEYQIFIQLGLLPLGLAIGLISVRAGDFWDRKAFDPKYGLRGAWLAGAPWSVFPSGSDLKFYRDRAIEKLKPMGVIDPESGERVYRESQKIIKKYPRRWDLVDRPNVLSKYCRNFILPSFAAAAVFLATAMWKLTMHEGGIVIHVGASLGFFLLAICLFIPYFSLRIEHMIQVYSEAVDTLNEPST